MISRKRDAILMLCLIFLAGASIATAEEDAASIPDDLKEKAIVDREWEKAADVNNDGIVDEVEIKQWRQAHPRKMEEQSAMVSTEEGTQNESSTTQDVMKDKAAVDRPWEKAADENKDGVVDKTEIKQWNRQGPDKDNNPPGQAGGPGTNWENPPGPKGGSGASPNRRGGMGRR